MTSAGPPAPRYKFHKKKYPLSTPKATLQEYHKAHKTEEEELADTGMAKDAAFPVSCWDEMPYRIK